MNISCTFIYFLCRISLNVQLDKVANAVLAQVHLQPENNTETHPNANETVNKQHHELKSENTNKTPSKVPRKRMFSMQDKIVVKKYFILWKKLINRKRDMMKMIDQKEKLDNFMEQLRKKRKIAETHTVNEKTMRERSSPENNKEKIQFENRYNAQKTIIEKQKQKLEEQNKVIEELKLGIIREDLYKSLNNVKVDLHEIFSKCSEKIKLHKVHLNLKENREKFMINSQKAPKIVQQMEERAIQRAQNRQLILERKRIIEEHRKRLLEEALEKKRVLEEAEKKKHLQLMAERRKRELELEKLRQSNKERYIYKIKIAEAFYKKILLAQSFRKLVYNCKNNKNNYNLAIQHYDSVIKQRYYYKWFDMVDDLWKLKGDLADALYSHSLLKRVIKIWYEVCNKLFKVRAIYYNMYVYLIAF